MKNKIENRFTSVKKSKTFRKVSDIFALHSKKVLDVGCGYGEYLDCFGKGSVGITITKKEVDYAERRGLKVVRGNAEQIDKLNLPKDFEIIWANNLFEHLLSPHAFLLRLKAIASKDTVLVLGVPVVPRLAHIMKLKKFEGALVSNHINFFTRQTLMLTVLRAGWKVDKARSFVFKSELIDNLFNVVAPHMYIVARNDDSFQYPSKKVLEWKEEQYYKYFLSITNQSND